MRPGTYDTSVGHEEHDRHREHDREDGDDRLRDGPEIVGERGPRPPSDDHTDRHADHERQYTERRRLPRDRRRHLATREPERLEECEVAPTPTHRGHQRVGDDRDREQRQHAGQHERRGADPLVADDV